MAYSIVQVARIAKATSRTPRHYDEIGLLPPAYVGGNGYRYCEEDQLLRLQQILDAIRDILDRQTDRLAALRVHQAGADASARLAELMREGVAPDDQRAIEATDAHYRWVCHFWTPNREAYTGLGRLYVDDPRFTASIDAVAPGLAAYLCDTVAAYARARLS